MAPQIRRVIYTTNAIESFNARLRKIIKSRGHFHSDDAASKLIWLALRTITAEWGRAAHNWKEAMNQFAPLYEDRFAKRPFKMYDRLGHSAGRLSQATPAAVDKSQRLEHENSDSPVWHSDYANHDEGKRDITDYIVGFYNSVRLHSTLDYCLPNMHEARHQKQPA